MKQIDPRDLKSFIRMFTEVSLCVWCLTRFGEQLWFIPTILGAYFLGNLAHAFASIRSGNPMRGAGLLLPAGLVAVAAGMQFTSIALLCAASTLTGFAMGVSWEPSMPSTRNRLVKIGAKLLGMTSAAAVLLGPLVFGTIAAILSIWLAAMNLKGQTIARAVEAPTWRGVDIVNIFHQSAYFSFVFTFWAVLPNAPPWTPALLFPLGWLGYWAMELRLSAAGQPYRPRALAFGHAVVSATMGIMAVTHSPFLVILCWFMTGIGGGTCYTMERAEGGRPGRLSDDVGAVLGVGSAALVLWYFPDPATVMIVAAIHASIAAIAALLTWNGNAFRRMRHAHR